MTDIMMLESIVAFGSGVFGLVILFVWYRGKIKVIAAESEKTKLVAESERAGLLAKNESYEKTDKELKLEIDRLRLRLEEESTQRASLQTSALRLPTLEAELTSALKEVSLLSSNYARLQAELEANQKQHVEKIEILENAKQKFTETFQSLSAEALQRNNASFLDLAKQSFETLHGMSNAQFEKREQAISFLISPVKQVLEKVETNMTQMEKERASAYEGLKQQVGLLLESERQLRTQTGTLVQALRSPTVRGRWGELQLRRVIELAGMVKYCDFDEQVSVNIDDKQLRPDLAVRLPGKKMLIVDAKAPLEAYLNAVESIDEGRKKSFLADYSTQVRSHMRQLSAKSYWSQFPVTPEFVILFLPGEMFFSAALQEDPRLIEDGAAQNVILATPTTLIALLKTIAYGWKQQDMTEQVQVIHQLGRELCDRVIKVGDHINQIGKSLGGSVKAYNEAVRSIESRLWVTARKFHKLKPYSDLDELKALPYIEQIPRFLPSENEGKSHVTEETFIDVLPENI